VRGHPIRLLGVFASGLTEREQLTLFESDDRRQRVAVRAMDAIRERFGPRSIVRARLLEADVPEPFERDHLSPPDGPALGRRGPREGGRDEDPDGA
jgi:hypothetical protein